MKIIDEALANAFRRLKAACKTNVEVARRVSLSQVHVARILTGRTNYLSDETWHRVQPILEPYIKPETTHVKQVSPPVSDPLLDYVNGAWGTLTPAQKGRLVSLIETFKTAATAPAAPASADARGAIEVACPRCKNPITAPNETGAKFDCPECGQRIKFGDKK